MCLQMMELVGLILGKSLLKVSIITEMFYRRKGQGLPRQTVPKQVLNKTYQMCVLVEEIN